MASNVTAQSASAATPRLVSIRRPMVGRNTTRAAGVLGLCALSGCHGGLWLNAVILLVTVGIFVGTLLLERSS